MCKILLMPGVKSSDAAWKLVGAIAGPMSHTDPHGMGYAAIGRNGTLFGERWLNNSDAFQNRTKISPGDLELKKVLGKAIDISESYNSFGKVTDRIASMALHSRFATCAKTMQNTHPFVRNGSALIHNGVIRNTKQLKNLSSTCDSECILNEYVDQGVPEDPDFIQEVADKLQGYYACGVLTVAEGMPPIFDVFKCETASLYVAQVKEIGMVYCTSDSVLSEAVNNAGLTLESNTIALKGGQLIRHHAVTGKVLEVVDFDSSGPAKMANHPAIRLRSWGSGKGLTGHSDSDEEMEEMDVDAYMRLFDNWPDKEEVE